MSKISLNNVSIEIPIFNADSRSLKKRILSAATAGKLKSEKGSVYVKALTNLSLTIVNGERIGVIGKNGAGKSTLLRVLAGVYRPSHGSINIQGSVASLIDVSLGIDHEATGRENIILRGALLGLKKAHILSKMDMIVNFSELGEFIDMPVRTYSTGMQMRLAFSISTVISPEILLMDEWLSVGDEEFKIKAETKLSEFVKSSNILVIASHSRQLIENTCNRVIWLEHGLIKMNGNPNEVCAEYFD